MPTPHIDLIPLRTAVGRETSTTLDVLIKITPPELEPVAERPDINLGLVIDRSGSMKAANKLAYAKAAATYAVQQLLPRDRVSVTIYDTLVQTLIPSTAVTNKLAIIQQIEQIQAGSSTALHAGWLEGSMQVSQHFNPQQLNRVVLLSDGLANVGETNPDVIASDVHGLADRGVSTSTMGVGDQFDEELLEAIALSGDGNYYYIDSPEQLPDIFDVELQGLTATVGSRVTLTIQPQAGVTVVDVLNDLERTPTGEIKLPNLIASSPFLAVVRLKVPAAESCDLCQVRLSWNAPDVAERQTAEATLTLPRVSAQALAELSLNHEVQEQVAILMAARAQREAAEQVRSGHVESARFMMQSGLAQACSLPASAPAKREIERTFSHLSAQLDDQDYDKFRKTSRYEANLSSRSSEYHRKKRRQMRDRHGKKDDVNPS